MSRRKTNKEFSEEVYSLVGDEYVFLEKYSGSGKKLKVMHNSKNCNNNVYHTSPSNFIQGRRCPICSTRKSDETFKSEVYDAVGDDYIFLERYKGALRKVKCKHNVCGNIWEIAPSSFINNKTRCPRCNGGLRMSNKDFIDKVSSLVGDEYKFLEKYINSKTKLRVRHNSEKCNYHTYEVTPSHFIIDNSRCPECYGNKKKTTEEFRNEVEEMTGGEYSVLGEYGSYHSKVRLIHNKKGCEHIYYVKPSNFYSGTRCPKCNESKGESEIGEVLTRKGVLFERQYTFADCRNKYPLPFDFAIFDSRSELSLLIEYDGIQHFESVEFFGGFEYLQETKVNDKIKDKYCQEKRIPLLRIPYWKIEEVEKIINDNIKIEENV